MKKSMTNPRQRSRPELQPKFPRLQNLLRKRQAPTTDWYTVADKDGLVQIKPRSPQ